MEIIMTLLDNSLNALLSLNSYQNIGKIATLYVIWKILVYIHLKIYHKFSVYSFVTDFLKLPYHQINIAFFMNVKRVVKVFQAVQFIKENYCTSMFKIFLTKRLIKEGYSVEKLEELVKQAFDKIGNK